MYWYNPTTRTSEKVDVPRTDEEAIEMLAGDADSAAFVSEFTRLRSLGMELEQTLIMVGHEGRLKHTVEASPRLARRKIADSLTPGAETTGGGRLGDLSPTMGMTGLWTNSRDHRNGGVLGEPLACRTPLLRTLNRTSDSALTKLR